MVGHSRSRVPALYTEDLRTLQGTVNQRTGLLPKEFKIQEGILVCTCNSACSLSPLENHLTAHLVFGEMKRRNSKYLQGLRKATKFTQELCGGRWRGT